MNGVELIQLIHRQWPATRVVFMSAYPAEVLAREGLDDLDVVFLAKPFTRDELVAKVGMALRPPKHQGEPSKTGGPSS